MKFFLLAFYLTASATFLPSNYNPTYMIRQGANYGGQQSDYLRQAHEIIAKAEKEIETAVKNEKSLPDLFFMLLEAMAKKRGQIAKEHQTHAAHEFGLRRDRGSLATAYTRLNRAGYTAYEKRVLDCLYKILDQMEHNQQQFLQKNYSFTDRALGHTSLIEIEILDKEDLEKQGWFTTPLQQKIPEWFPVELFQKRRTFTEEKQLYSAVKCFWGNDRKGFQWLEKNFQIQLFCNDLPPHYNPIKRGLKPPGPLQWMDTVLSLKTILVELRAFFEIDGKLQPLYSYFTALYRNPADPNENLLKRMQTHSIPLLVHQTQFLIEETLKDAASIFEQIVRWEGSDLNELKQLMALFRFEMSCMPFQRGSAAITEWFEAALYNHHRVSYKLDEKHCADLEVYCNPLFADFLKAYDTICTLSLKK